MKINDFCLSAPSWEASQGLRTASWESFGGLSEASWGRLEVSCGGDLDISVRIPLFGPLLGPSWNPFNFLGRLWGRLEALLGRLGALFRPPRAVLEPLWQPLGRSWSVGTYIEKTNENQRFLPLGAFLGSLFGPPQGFLGVFWGPLGGLLEPPGGLLGRRSRFFSSYSLSRAPLGLSWGHVSPLGRLLGRIEAVFGRRGALFRPPGVVLEPFWERLGRS